MTNSEIAKVLEEIAKILELKGEDRFRVTAYERAAQSVSSFGEDLKDLYEREGLKGLEEIEGAGESIGEKIEELIHTGKLKYYEDLKKTVPSSEVEFLEIPGIGPKTAIKLAKELKAKDIKELKKSLESEKGKRLFKEKSRENILRGIKILKGFEGRLLLSEALPVAEKYHQTIKAMPEVEKCDIVGSLRRMKETIGDIDIVAAAKDSINVIDKFTKVSTVKEIVAKGETKATVIDKTNIQVDLEILPKEEYGSLLQHFTGSKEHNVALRTFAVSKRMSVSEHGIKIRGKLKTFSEEEGVYKTLGMDWIPPELREDRGEIEAALKHQLPQLIELDGIRGDLHVHSNWSDGSASIEEMAEKALEIGYQYLAISDHTVGLGVAGGLSVEDFEKREKEIERVRKRYPQIKILSSCEVNIRADATLDLPEELLENFDVVTASIHSSFFQKEEQMTARLIKAISYPHLDIIGHPSGRLIGQRPSYDVNWEEVFQAAAKHQTALEISAFPNRLDLKDSLVKEAKDKGVIFAINTDAHQPPHLELMKYGIAVARRGWLEKETVVNTWPYEKLKQWLNR